MKRKEVTLQLRVAIGLLEEGHTEKAAEVLRRLEETISAELKPTPSKEIVAPSKDEVVLNIVQSLENGQEISISFLQRKFNVGYIRAAKVIEYMESLGQLEGVSGTTRLRVVKK